MKVYNPPKPPKCEKCGLFQGFAGMHTRTCQCPEYLESKKKIRPPHLLVGKFDQWAKEKYPTRVFNLEDKELAAEFAKALLKEAAEKIEQGKDPQSILQCSKETGLGAVTQVYFRKGTNWAKEIIRSLIPKEAE